MAQEMAKAQPHLFPAFIVEPMIQGKLLPELEKLPEEQLRAMLAKARDFIGEMLREDLDGHDPNCATCSGDVITIDGATGKIESIERV